MLSGLTLGTLGSRPLESAEDATPSTMESTNDHGSESCHTSSASRLETSVERCDIKNPGPGTKWHGGHSQRS